MSFDRSDPALAYTLPFQLTKKIHRTVPDILQPESPDLDASGRIVVITGGGSGIGAVSILVRSIKPRLTSDTPSGGRPRVGHGRSRGRCDRRT